MESHDQALVDLIARCALRDQAALRHLFERVGGYLNSTAYRMLHSDELANEVLQDAFLQIWQNAASYRPQLAKPLTWMTSILRYRALDRLDREVRYRQRIVLSEQPEHFDRRESASSPEREVGNVQLQQHIHQCLAALNDKVRQSITLAYLEGFSREEIALRLTTNANTVKSWLRRGGERLKQCLQDKLSNATPAP